MSPIHMTMATDPHVSLIDEILPVRGNSYNICEVDQIIAMQQDRVELDQRKNNKLFETVLDSQMRTDLQGLHGRFSKLQLAILKFQCDISYVKEQYDVVESIRENPLIKERHEIEQSLQQLKFKTVLDFFELYAGHLESSIQIGRAAIRTDGFEQLFDWTYYHRILLSLRACGKAQMDIDKLERLYQSKSNIVSIMFKQPLNSIQFNNFIEFHDTFSLETQLVTKTRQGESETIDQLLADLTVSETQLEYQLFGSVLARVKTATVECCRLLLDINMSYIEAHLTDGINIDKLNGTESAAFPAQEDPSLPLYALSPQEYITQIGQHLLTLRKHTEQFDAGDAKPLKLGLESLQPAQGIPIDVHSYKTVTEIVMRYIARHCIRSLLGRTSNSILSKLTVRGKRQLATDALYLDNVLEDLRLLDPDEPNILKFKNLLSP